MLKQPVADWMTRRVLEVRPDAPVFAALEVMAEQGVRHVLVMNDATLVGIVSNRDVVRAALRHPERRLDLHQARVADVMTPVPLVTTWPGATLAEVAEAMRAKRVSALPVFDGERVAGIITTDDVLAAVAAPDPAPTRRPDI
ncbi:MAG: CBS domain-containing protein [Planctomycetes bacterium]|nr:CBS domain-containing protein [Planctomycetota bacterium]